MRSTWILSIRGLCKGNTRSTPQKSGSHPSDHCQQHEYPQHERDHLERQAFPQIHGVYVHEHQAEVAVPEVEAVDLGDRLVAEHPGPIRVVAQNDQEQDRKNRIHGILKYL